VAAACGAAVPGGARRHPVLGSGRDMQMVRAVVRSQIIAELRKSWHLEMPWPQLGTARSQPFFGNEKWNGMMSDEADKSNKGGNH
jgi:hypothetical protein